LFFKELEEQILHTKFHNVTSKLCIIKFLSVNLKIVFLTY
jgi:hypothetical protein